MLFGYIYIEWNPAR